MRWEHQQKAKNGTHSAFRSHTNSAVASWHICYGGSRHFQITLSSGSRNRAILRMFLTRMRLRICTCSSTHPRPSFQSLSCPPSMHLHPPTRSTPTGSENPASPQWQSAWYLRRHRSHLWRRCRRPWSRHPKFQSCP